jgi:hypothetical protein
VFRAGVGGGLGSYLLSFRSDLDAADSSRSGRTWTLLGLPVPVGERRVKGSGMAGVPSQREGTGREKRRKREGRGSLAMGGNGPGRKGRKQESRGSLAIGGNGPGREEKAGKLGSLAMGGNGPGREEKA